MEGLTGMDTKKTGGRPRISRVYRSQQIPFPKEIERLLDGETPYEDLKPSQIRKLDKIIQPRVKEVRDAWTAEEMSLRQGNHLTDDEGNLIESSSLFPVYSLGDMS